MKVKTDNILQCLGNQSHHLMCNWLEIEEVVCRNKNPLLGFLLAADYVPHFNFVAHFAYMF